MFRRVPLSLSVVLVLGSISLVIYCSVQKFPKQINGSVTKNEMLKRQLLFHGIPPNVRATPLQMFDSREVTDAIGLLLAGKERHRNDTEYFQLGEFEGERVKLSETLHVSFVGDSRIRQLFAMFMTAIPDYDRVVYPPRLDIRGQVIIPSEVIAYSPLQRLLVSYYWRSLLIEDDGRDLTDFFDAWLKPEPSKNSGTIVPSPHPDVLVIGISLHHMLRAHNYHEKVYFDYLKKLVPTLQAISKKCQVIWLNQYPTQELYGGSGAHNTDVHARKIFGYNQVAETILRDGGIAVWSSGSPLVEEYIRSCLLNRRQDAPFKFYFDCSDYVHPGSSVLTDSIQILYNLVLPTRA